MKRLLILAFCLIPLLSKAQIPVNEPSKDFVVRMSVDLDYKLKKGLHLLGGIELREGKDFLSEGRMQASAGLSYKLNPYLKTSASYTLIRKKQSVASYAIRHRFEYDLTESYDLNSWKFSLREKVRVTNRTGYVNRWQSPRNLLDATIRAKVRYSYSKRLSQYASVEFRSALNKPVLKGYHYDSSQHRYVDVSGSPVGEPGWFFDGYGDFYFNRERFCLGFEWKWNKHRSMDVYALYDNGKNIKINAESDGTRLNSLVKDRYYRFSPGVKFTFAF